MQIDHDFEKFRKDTDATLKQIANDVARTKSIHSRNMVSLGWIVFWAFVTAIAVVAIAVRLWFYWPV